MGFWPSSRVCIGALCEQSLMTHAYGLYSIQAYTDPSNHPCVGTLACVQGLAYRNSLQMENQQAVKLDKFWGLLG